MYWVWFLRVFWFSEVFARRHYGNFFTCCTECSGCGFCAFFCFSDVFDRGTLCPFFSCCTACSGCGLCAFLVFLMFLVGDIMLNFLAVARHVVGAVCARFWFF